MIVHRLRAWFSRIAVLLAGQRANAIHLTAAIPAQTRQPLVGAASARPSRGGDFASGSWLADSHRLRERPQVRPARSGPGPDQLRRILRDPQWAPTYEATSRSKRPQHPSDTHAAERPEPAPSSRPMTSSSASSDGELGHERRRLIYVRELVRRGVYNEGFDPARMPEQYRPKQQPPENPLP